MIRPTVRRLALVALALAVLSSAGCAALDGAEPADVVLPPTGSAPDYQLGGAYEPDPAVDVVARDRASTRAPGRYSICYVNGFQTQPGERDLWPDDLLLTSGGADVVDPDWPDEVLLDTSTAERRTRIADLVGPWIEGCAASGFDAVEFDNLDSYTRSGGAMTFEDNLALAAAFVDLAHGTGLAAGQKNAAEESDRLQAELCDAPDAPASLVLRDRDLAVPGDAAYVFELCDA